MFEYVGVYVYVYVCLQSVDGGYVCLATMFEYKILNYETNSSQELFPIDATHLSPVITRISRVSLRICCLSERALYMCISTMLCTSCLFYNGRKTGARLYMYM